MLSTYRMRSACIALLTLLMLATLPIPAGADRATQVAIISGPPLGKDDGKVLDEPFSTENGVVLYFPLPDWLKNADDTGIVSAELRLVLVEKPIERSLLNVQKFGFKNLNRESSGVVSIRNETLKNTLISDGAVALELTNGIASWHGPKADPALRPRLVLTFTEPDRADYRSAGVSSLISSETYWPSTDPTRLVPLVVSPGNVRSLAPVFRAGQTIFLAGDENAPVLKGFDGVSGRPAWTSDAIETKAQHLVLSPDGERLYLLGDGAIRRFDFATAPPYPAQPMSDPVSIAGFELRGDIPPVVGQGGNVFFVTQRNEVHGLDPASRELWSVPLRDPGALTLGPRGAAVFVGTKQGLTVIDAGTGDVQVLKPSETLQAVLDAEGAVLHAPLAVIGRKDGHTAVMRLYAAASTPGATEDGAIDIFEMPIDLTEPSQPGFSFVTTVENTRGQPIPDAYGITGHVDPVQAAQAETRSDSPAKEARVKSILAMTIVDQSRRIMAFDWSTGEEHNLSSSTAMDVNVSTVLPPVYPVRDGANRVLVLTGQTLRTVADASLSDKLSEVELGALEGLRGGARLMIADDGRLFLRDTESTSRKVWALVPEIDISDSNDLCGPTFFRVLGQPGSEISITSGAGVMFAPGASLAPGSSVSIAPCD